MEGVPNAPACEGWGPVGGRLVWESQPVAGGGGAMVGTTRCSLARSLDDSGENEVIRTKKMKHARKEGMSNAPVC